MILKEVSKTFAKSEFIQDGKSVFLKPSNNEKLSYQAIFPSDEENLRAKFFDELCRVFKRDICNAENGNTIKFFISEV